MGQKGQTDSPWLSQVEPNFQIWILKRQMFLQSTIEDSMRLVHLWLQAYELFRLSADNMSLGFRPSFWRRSHFCSCCSGRFTPSRRHGYNITVPQKQGNRRKPLHFYRTTCVSKVVVLMTPLRFFRPTI